MSEKPCEKCHVAHKCGPGWEITPHMCTDYGLWVTVQEGYAAASRDIIDYLRRNGYDRLVNQLSDWLKQKGAL